VGVGIVDSERREELRGEKRVELRRGMDAG
jgi:hypothetical protein